MSNNSLLGGKKKEKSTPLYKDGSSSWHMSVDNIDLDPNWASASVWSVNETAECLIGLHGLFCHLYFSVHRGYLRNYNCCWVGYVLMFFNQMEFCFSVDDNDDEGSASLALYLFVLMCFLADERSLGYNNHEDLLIFRF